MQTSILRAKRNIEPVELGAIDKRLLEGGSLPDCHTKETPEKGNLYYIGSIAHLFLQQSRSFGSPQKHRLFPPTRTCFLLSHSMYSVA